MALKYSKQVLAGVYPPENRVLAGVAAVRTFKQTIKSALVVSATGGAVGVPIAVTQEQLTGLVVPVFLIGVGVLVLNAAIAAGVAFDDVAQNGLSPKYSEVFQVEEEERGKYGDYGIGETSDV